MNMKSPYYLLCAIFLCTFGCSIHRTGFDFISSTKSNARPYTFAPHAKTGDAFQFAIVADRCGGARPGVFEKAMDQLNWLQPEFVMCVGDLIEGYTTDTLKIKTEQDELTQIVSKLEMPFFRLVGNHDVGDDGQQLVAAEWHKRFGQSYYAFTYRDVLFICLDTMDNAKTESGAIGSEQAAFIKETLKKHRDVRWTMVFMHKPLFLASNTPAKDPGFSAIEDVLKDRPHTIFAGHYHEFEKTRVANGDCYVLATTGGASQLKGPAEGSFDEIVWVTMTAKGPVIANLMVDGIYPSDAKG